MIERFHPAAIALCTFGATVASMAHGQTAERLEDGRWRAVMVRRVADVVGFQVARDSRLSPYGGDVNSRLQGTGFFRTTRKDGRWWLVDPGGSLFLSVGLCSVNLSMVDDLGSWPGKLEWAAATSELLRRHGFNTLGRWSDAQAFRSLSSRLAYCTSLRFMDTYKELRAEKNGAPGFPLQTMPVFDPEFEKFCKEYARRLKETQDDPWLLGHFSDNELPFRPHALQNYLALPASDTGHQAAVAFLKSRGKTVSDYDAGDEAAFLTRVAERYYSTVAEAINEHDPNHLYLGSRLHGRCIREAVFRGAGAVDIVSVNYYHRWSAEVSRLSDWVRLSGRPFLVSEWYAMALDRRAEKVHGAGFRVRTQRDRGLFYQNMALGLLEHPGCVGWHWFKYGGAHKGVVTPDFSPQKPLLELMQELNRQVYPLAFHFLERPRSRLPVRVIFDTDMDTDCDDAGALAMLHALADRKEASILATVVSSRYPYSAPCVEAINRYYGRPELPIGVPKGDGASTSRGSRYAETIAEEYTTRLGSNDDAPSGATVYRKVLAAQPERSVVIVTVGYLTNIRDLLATGPDAHSELTGQELVKRKVKYWVCMGGRYPEERDPGVHGNFKPDPEAAVTAIADWPGVIYFSGNGRKIQTGRLLRSKAPENNPVRRIYDLYLGRRPTRPSWDQVALLYAIRPGAPYWNVETSGYNHIFPNGTNEWRREPATPSHRLVDFPATARTRITRIIDKLMVDAGRSDGRK